MTDKLLVLSFAQMDDEKMNKVNFRVCFFVLVNCVARAFSLLMRIMSITLRNPTAVLKLDCNRVDAL